MNVLRAAKRRVDASGDAHDHAGVRADRPAARGNLIHYEILMTTVMGVALFLPPFGVGLYIVLGLSGATIGETSRHLLPYLATMMAVAVVIAFVPWIVYFVPYVFNLYTPL